MIHFIIVVALLSLFGCHSNLNEPGSPLVQITSVNETGMVACQFAAAHHPKLVDQKADRTRGDASATARRAADAAAKDCHRRLTGPQ